MRNSFLPFVVIIPLFAIVTCAEMPKENFGVGVPLTFEVNRGQTTSQVQYLARTREGIVFFTNEGITISSSRYGSFRLLFEKVERAARIVPGARLAAHTNYLDHDSSKQILGLENYAAVTYRALYPEIDVRFYGTDRHLEHDFILGPGADEIGRASC